MVDGPPLRLDSLPAEIIHRIGHFLQPTLPSTTYSSSPHSSLWTQSALDLIALSSTSRGLWLGARSLVGRQFGARAQKGAGGCDVAARLDCVSGDGEEGGMPNLFAGEGPREQTEEEREQRALVAVERNLPHLIQPPNFFVPGMRIRHFHLSSSGTYSIYYQSTIISQAIRSMPRLESFALAHTSEEELVASSPSACAYLPSDVLVALAERPLLRAMYLCGTKVINRPAQGPEVVDIPEFGKKLEEIHLSAVHDSSLQLIQRAPALKRIHAWRDFARAPRITTDQWWTDETWKCVEEIDLTGLGGNQGREMLEAWLKSLVTLRASPSKPVIPLRSLRLFEPHHNTLFFSTVLPAFAALPQLESLAFILWRDRHFTSRIFSQIAEHLPNLKELTLGMENEQLNWWPGNMAEYGHGLASLPKLECLTWNFTPYADITFDEVRPTVMGAVQHLSAQSPQLSTIRWIGEECHLVRESASAPWVWRGEPPAPQVTVESLPPSKDEEEEEVIERERDRLSVADKENVDPVEQAFVYSLGDPFADTLTSSKGKGKARGVEEGTSATRSAPGSSTSAKTSAHPSGKRKEKLKGPRRSLFGELARSASANSVVDEWDLQRIPSRASTSRGSPSVAASGGGSVAGSGCEDDSGFFE